MSCPITYKSPLFGDVNIVAERCDKYESLALEKTADGQIIQQYLGSPVAAESVTAKGFVVQYFERGMLTGRPGSSGYVVYGPIYMRYQRLGGIDSFLGAPTSDEADFNGGRVQHFENGIIVWSSASGAYEICGPIREYWNNHFQLLGFPLTGVISVTNEGGAEVGERCTFQRAVVYSHIFSGTHEIHGDILNAYENKYGGPLGPLGFPTSDETDTPGHTGRYNNFQMGVLVSHPDGSPYAGVYPFLACEFFLGRLEIFDTDPFGTEVELYANVDISASDGQRYPRRFPDDGDYGHPSRDIQEVLLSFPVMSGDLTVHVHMDGWDKDDTSGDDYEGTVEEDLTADNLWGTTENFEHRSENFQATYQMRLKAEPYDPTKDWRLQCFWPFHNFDTDELSWHQYAETFSDVSDDESHWLHPFNWLFYTWFYKGVAKNGNCGGMCLESIYAQVGRSFFAEPIYRYGPIGSEPSEPADHNLINEINIKQGYQIGDTTIDYFLWKFISGGTHDPVGAYNESRAAHAAGNYPMLALTKAEFSFTGHVVRPYEWQDLGGNQLAIRVANPN